MPTSPRLVCPQCGAPLDSLADGAGLSCAACLTKYPVITGIPRFVTQSHLASFGFQWNKYQVAHDEEDRATFQAKTGLALQQLKGLAVLDAGCGGGRYSKVAAEAGAQVVGVDHSNAVESAARLCTHLPNARFVQGDLKQLPFAPESFDVVFSIGVMHHDASTRALFDAVARMVRPGGYYAVWLYRRNQWWQEWLNRAVRRRTTRMPAASLERWCRLAAALGGVPLLNRTLNKIVNFSNHPCQENRLCDNYDWYAPVYQHHHTPAELEGWFRQAGFAQLRTLPPERSGPFYRWCWRHNLIIGSGVNMAGRKMPGQTEALP
jgi:SAM-dependent methyltransferase